MTISSYFKELFRFRREKTNDKNLPTTLVRGAGYPIVTAGTPMAVATVYRCVKLLSESVANLAIQNQRLKGDVYVEDHTNPLGYLLNVEPTPELSAFDMWRQAVADVLFTGNAYIVPTYSTFPTPGVSRLALCGRGTVAHDTANDIYTVNDVNMGVSGVFKEDEIIHIKGLTLGNPKTGLGVIEFARRSMNIATTGDNETLHRFANGGNVRGIVSNDMSAVRGFGEYQDRQLEKVAEDLDDKFQGGARIVAVPGQAHLETLSLSSTDMQFLESRKFTVREICRFFGVPPTFVFDDTSNNYKSVEQANVDFLSRTLDPLLKSIEKELQRKLIPERLYGKRRIQFDRRGLYACDLDSRVKYQSQTIAAGIYTINEWRREENKGEVEGGDKVLVSANLKALEELTAPATEEIEVEEDPVTEPNQEENNDED